MKLNFPTKLTVIRIVMIPVCMLFIIYPFFYGDILWRIVAASLFIVISLTDMLDGMLARKWNMVTDIGKFLDPIADKMLVIGVMIAILLRYGETNPTFCNFFGWTLFVTILREMSVTSLRMIASNKSGAVLAAAWLGKVKTTVQMVGIVIVLIEPIFFSQMIFSYIAASAMIIMTVLSGLDYFRAYLPLIAETENK